MLTLWLNLMLVAFYVGIQTAQARTRLFSHAVVGLAAGMAFLTKGFLAFVVLALVVLVGIGRMASLDGRFELAQAGREHVRRYSEIALQITIALWPVEQPLHDQQRPPCSHDIEGRGEVAHAVVSVSGFIQNGE